VYGGGGPREVGAARRLEPVDALRSAAAAGQLNPSHRSFPRGNPWKEQGVAYNESARRRPRHRAFAAAASKVSRALSAWLPTRARLSACLLVITLRFVLRGRRLCRWLRSRRFRCRRLRRVGIRLLRFCIRLRRVRVRLAGARRRLGRTCGRMRSARLFRRSRCTMCADDAWRVERRRFRRGCNRGMAAIGLRECRGSLGCFLDVLLL